MRTKILQFVNILGFVVAFFVARSRRLLRKSPDLLMYSCGSHTNDDVDVHTISREPAQVAFSLRSQALFDSVLSKSAFPAKYLDYVVDTERSLSSVDQSVLLQLKRSP